VLGLHHDHLSRTFAGMTTDPHAELRDRVYASVLDGPGQADSALRHAAADGAGLPAELQTLVHKIRHHAYKVTDEDLAHLTGRYDDDQLFEIVVSAALGASRQRLVAGLSALEHA
jgi:hypothetical protein